MKCILLLLVLLSVFAAETHYSVDPLPVSQLQDKPKDDDKKKSDSSDDSKKDDDKKDD